MNLQGKIVLVLGMGETGLSMVKWLSRQGAQVRVADSRMEPPGWKEIAESFPLLPVYKGKFEAKIFDDIIVYLENLDKTPHLDLRTCLFSMVCVGSLRK